MKNYQFDSAHHIHLLDGKPLIGTTTALYILDKPGLVWWGSSLACAEFGWVNPKKASVKEFEEASKNKLAEIKQMDNEQYLRLLNTAYRAHSVKKTESAEKGISLHEQIENYIKCKVSGTEPLLIDDSIKPFVEWSEKNVSRFLFSELHCYSEVLWAGGIIDFCYIDKQGRNVLGDIKSSEKPYYSHWLQLGAYTTQLSENGGYTPEGKRVFTLDKPIAYHAVFCERGGLGKPFFNFEMDGVRKAFAYCINLYKEKIWWDDKKCVKRDANV